MLSPSGGFIWYLQLEEGLGTTYKLACLTFLRFLFTAVGGRSRQINRVDGKGKDGKGWMHHRPAKQLLISCVQLSSFRLYWLVENVSATIQENTMANDASTFSAGHP